MYPAAEPQMCRKRSAFRQKIRRQYIQNIFQQRRKQLYSNQPYKKQIDRNQQADKLNTQEIIKQIDQFKIGLGLDHGSLGNLQYPYTSNFIPKIQKAQYFEQNEQSESRNNNSFNSYNEFQKYLNQMVKLLPQSIYSLVLLFNNNPELINEFIKYVIAVKSEKGSQEKNRLKILISKFCECSVSEYLNFLHLVQSIILKLEQNSMIRIKIIEKVSEQVPGRIFSLLQSNKISRMDIYKGYFDFLITLGDDIRILKNIDIAMLGQCIKDIFIKYFTLEEENINLDLCDSIILLCNNIVSLSSHQDEASQNKKISQLDDYYQVTELKQLFISELKNPPQTLHNMILIGMSPPTDLHLQHILRFFVNLTFVIQKAETIYLFLNPLSILIMSLLAQYKLLKHLSMTNILILRLINNIAVNDIYSANFLWKQGIISKLVERYGGWVLKRLQKNSTAEVQNQYEPETHVFTEFISTITTFVVLLNNYCSQNYEIEIVLIIQQLMKRDIQSILLESLTISSLLATDTQMLSKVLQALLVLSNYQSNMNNHHFSNGINQKLPFYSELFENIRDGVDNLNIVNFCQSLLEVVKLERERNQESKRYNQYLQKQQLMADQYQNNGQKQRECSDINDINKEN